MMIKQSMYKHTCMFMSTDAGHDNTDVIHSIRMYYDGDIWLAKTWMSHVKIIYKGTKMKDFDCIMNIQN